MIVGERGDAPGPPENSAGSFFPTDIPQHLVSVCSKFRVGSSSEPTTRFWCGGEGSGMESPMHQTHAVILLGTII